MSPIELVLFYLGFWGLILLITSTVDACNATTKELLHEAADRQESQACCSDPDDEPEQWGAVPSL